MKRSMIHNGLILGAFAVVTTTLIALTFTGTEKTIEQQEREKVQAILDAIIPNHLYDNDVGANCTQVTDENNESLTVYRATLNEQPSALAIEAVAPDGYSGRIKMIVGITDTGLVTGVRVLKHKETPGLGDKIDIRVSDWILNFEQQAYSADNDSSWAVRKDGGKFDQFTGATITPRAVVNAVKQSVLYYQQHKDEMFEADNACHVPETNNE